MTKQLTLHADKTIRLQNETMIIKYRFASFGERLLARIIDVAIIIIPNSIVPIIPAWLYWSIQQSGESQATVGQDATGIRTLSSDGMKISFGQATGRFFASFLSALLFFIGYFMFFFNKKNQCLHDYLSGCIVVKEVERIYKEESDNKTLLDKDYI